MKYLSVKDVALRYSIGRSTVWLWVKTNKLPSPLKISEHTTRWIEHELDAHDESKPRLHEQV